jgi:hypothetical protein
MASSFEDIETSHLIDLLSRQTAMYTQYLKTGIDSPEYQLCKLWIKQLQKEINTRHQTEPNCSISDTTIAFEDKDVDIAGTETI